MIYEISNEKFEINFLPASETEEIIQNACTILATIKGSCPLFRNFGVSVENLDAPINIVKNKIAAELAAELAQFEPRCRLKSVNVSGDLNGQLKITAKIEI